MDVRTEATTVVAKLLTQDGSLSTLIPSALERVKQQDRSLLQELCYGTARWQPRLKLYLDALMDKPLRNKDNDVRALLLIGLYQLAFLRIPSHAAIHESVAVATKLKKNWAKGLVNGVLRRFQREQAQLDQQLASQPVFQTSHPAWLMAAMTQAWPENCPALFDINNSRPPMTLRVNQQRISRNDYLQLLADGGIPGLATPYSEHGIVLDVPTDVEALPHFRQGYCSVQDEAAQLAAPLLELASHQRVLDACCAPGGKTAHILECQPTLQTCVGLDISAERMQRTADNLRRLDLQAQLLVADANQPDVWWDGQQFDRILVDAPCSGSGVIRRHPDIKILRDSANVAKLAATQLTLLQALWPLLAPGGIMLYATCSILPEENTKLVARFVEQHDDAAPVPIHASWGVAQPFGRQLLPAANSHDGFFYAKLRKSI